MGATFRSVLCSKLQKESLPNNYVKIFYIRMYVAMLLRGMVGMVHRLFTLNSLQTLEDLQYMRYSDYYTLYNVGAHKRGAYI